MINIDVMGEPCIRPMVAADLSILAAIEKHATPTPWSLKNFSDSLQGHDCCRVLVLAEQVIGNIVYSQVLDEVSLLNITISPAFQGRGYGRLLLQNMLAQVAANDASQCFLEVRASNIAAIHLYQACQFAEIGRRKNYYQLQGQREDALVMKREL
ncbi:[Ribosomal protein S18]-alanine N-acetyltransferase [Sinobacterium norvegicum]|uniref:[Ribosomal protein bS18]-alanine N-acetyltransferase n=1 Tax=Sinobacterium norvegicum TaxID=1641715 RepID=A0ABN8EKN3_9GAMM|nr:ribosomal protein S18-alanine N-acetyltransferase [Sinobacterium norvegicum]CAH0992290.1 [Ribosomal protein S18]-alanine N-acetyltransferase [Sinobacterium norvegicum]